MKKIVSPKWRVPESIKAREERRPSMLKGGGQMTAFGLQLETKDGQPLDWRRSTGPRRISASMRSCSRRARARCSASSSSPSQPAHRPDARHAGQVHVRLHHARLQPRLHARAQSAGLCRGAAARGQGLDAAKIRELSSTGPLDNGVIIILVHITYFTARSGDGGRIETFRDVYGHGAAHHAGARRAARKGDRQGRDHLAPVELDLAAGVTRATRNANRVADGSRGGQPRPPSNFMEALFGGSY